jgi:GNAT superfamily N-acetyltransferase
MHELRIARPTNDLERVRQLYCRGLGLDVLDSFVDHDGFDGIMLGHRGDPVHLEFTRQRGVTVPRADSADDLLVFYVRDEAGWSAGVERMLRAGFVPVAAHNPYWDRGGRTFEDFEGRRVVLYHQELDRAGLHEGASDAAVRFLEEQVDEFNMATTGFRDARNLALFLRDEAGAIRAGLTGHTWGGCCEVRFFWVRESERGRGLGRMLLAAAEREALARGCDRVVLSSHTFQAPGFYEKQGYSVVGEAKGHPRGYAQVYLQKVLR